MTRYVDDIPLFDRILDRIIMNPIGCWEWLGSKGVGGYGQIGYKGKTYWTHRVVYENFFQIKIPEGMVIDHMCKNPECVNPRHLRVLTKRANTLAGSSPVVANWENTSCPKGHLFDEINTYIRKNGTRYCKSCQKERNKKYNMRCNI